MYKFFKLNPLRYEFPLKNILNAYFFYPLHVRSLKNVMMKSNIIYFIWMQNYLFSSVVDNIDY